jgi:hypothetical protein
MPSNNGIFFYGEDNLTPSKAIKISQGILKGELSKTVIEKIQKSHDHIAAIVKEGKVVYGINTGFGSLCRTIISSENTQKLQDNLIRSHSVGVGEPVPLSITKLMLENPLTFVWVLRDIIECDPANNVAVRKRLSTVCAHKRIAGSFRRSCSSCSFISAHDRIRQIILQWSIC